MIQDAGWAGGQHPMVRALSNDLRKRVVAAVARGESCRSVFPKFESLSGGLIEFIWPVHDACAEMAVLLKGPARELVRFKASSGQ
jgi:hypothetical protein